MGEKTEKATPKKLRDAKKKGQVAKSQDLPAAATFITALFALVWMISRVYDEISKMFTGCFSLVTHHNLPEVLGSLFWQALYTIFVASIPIVLAVCFVGTLVTFLTVGPVFAPDVFKFDIKKFNPIENLKSKFKLKTFIELGKSIAKIAIAAVIVYKVVKESVPVLIQSINLSVPDALTVLIYFMWEVAVRVGLFFIGIAIFDFMYQKHTFNKEMMMEKFEIKQEYKETEGSPEIKGRRREVAREIAYSEGPAAGASRANAVVTNPNSIAIALGFEKGLDPCPYILAMGMGGLAEEIIKIAEKKGIPIIRNIPLAHTLWDKAKLYEYIPEETYEPVAEIMRWLAELEHEKAVSSLNM
jgi:type III secretion protein U